ncbi:MJ0042-type zinc finger domain-containing protein [Bradyrhizobium sp. ORS 111]|uniref:MJ0042-type zinc finger domain-containing protein n=1 Tax=Bradyrhizobium sp. ORS 111 TaxID=1685958 RepID=UPI00388DD174
MVQTWKTGPGEDHACPHCGAIYAVTIRRLPAKDRDDAPCVECGKELASWNSTSVPSFKLKTRADGRPA